MIFNHKNVLVTGANRGIGRALVEALLKENVKKVYAAARCIDSLPDFHDGRVIPIALDIIHENSVMEALKKAEDVDILFNNAGVLHVSSVLDSNLDDLKIDMDTNYYGTVRMVQAFAPLLIQKGSGAIANTISIVGLSSVPMIGGYCASKAALYSATQALRAELKNKGIHVHGIYPGPIDTDMTAGMDLKKTPPSVVASNILQGMKDGVEDIFPDPISVQLSQFWQKDPRSLVDKLAGM